jgi:hypothetical protein
MRPDVNTYRRVTLFTIALVCLKKHRDVGSIEHCHQIGGFTFQRQSEPENRDQVWRWATSFQFADPRLGEAAAFGELHLRQAALLTQLAQSLTEELSNALGL